MAPNIHHLTPTGAKEEPADLGNATNDKTAQPLTNGENTKDHMSKTVVESNGKDNKAVTESDAKDNNNKGVTESNAKHSKTDKNSSVAAVGQTLPTLGGGFHVETDQPKKKKKKNKSKKQGPTTSHKVRGTGFESYYCDPPMTPEEAQEEKNELYAADLPFVDRIETCIQRYRARRRMDNTRTNLFNKYLALGGIDTTQRMFQGLKSLDVDGATKKDIREMTAGDVIYRGSSSVRYYNPNEPEHWDVDFAGVVAGFFSERVFKLAGTDMNLIQVGADVVENFLNYVLHHDVCPEYADDIHKAKDICRDAVDQITRCCKVIWTGPGDFNIACQVLFDHGKRKIYDPDSTLTEYDMPVEQAQRIFYASIAAHEMLYQKLKGKPMPLNSTEVIAEVKQTFEVVDVCEPNHFQTQLYLGVKNMAGKTGRIQPCGTLVLKPIAMEDGWDKGDASTTATGIGLQEEFFLDWSVLQYITVGMKMKLIVCISNIDFKFIKAFADVRPRYYTFLPQELMLRYKEPVPNERSAPSVENPEMDDGDDGNDGNDGNADE